MQANTRDLYYSGRGTPVRGHKRDSIIQLCRDLGPVEEAAWHERFRKHQVGQEIFTPAPEIMAAINEIRLSMRLSPVE